MPNSHSHSLPISDRAAFPDCQRDMTDDGVDENPTGIALFGPTESTTAAVGTGNEVAMNPLEIAADDSFDAVAAPNGGCDTSVPMANFSGVGAAVGALVGTIKEVMGSGEVAVDAAAGIEAPVPELEKTAKLLTGGTAHQHFRGPNQLTQKEKDERDERRRNKNRESAARANKKRKEKNDFLKSQLAMWKAQQDELE